MAAFKALVEKQRGHGIGDAKQDEFHQSERREVGIARTRAFVYGPSLTRRWRERAEGLNLNQRPSCTGTNLRTTSGIAGCQLGIRHRILVPAPKGDWNHWEDAPQIYLTSCGLCPLYRRDSSRGSWRFLRLRKSQPRRQTSYNLLRFQPLIWLFQMLRFKHRTALHRILCYEVLLTLLVPVRCHGVTSTLFIFLAYSIGEMEMAFAFALHCIGNGSGEWTGANRDIITRSIQ